MIYRAKPQSLRSKYMLKKVISFLLQSNCFQFLNSLRASRLWVTCV